MTANMEAQKQNTVLRNKDITELAKYYNLVKFSDSGYFGFKMALNIKEADEYTKILKTKGYSEEEAGEERRRYLNALNENIIADAQAVSDSYKPATMSTTMSITTGSVDWEGLTGSLLENQEEALKTQEQAIEQYYNAVKFMDSDYVTYKTGLIQTQSEEMIKAGGEKVAVAQWVAEQRKVIDDNLHEYQEKHLFDSLGFMQSGFDSFYSSVKNVQLDFMNGFKGFTESLKSAWKSAINSMVNEVVNQFIVSGVFKFFSFILGGPGAGAMPIGTGEGIPLGGNILSVGTSPFIPTAITEGDTINNTREVTSPFIPTARTGGDSINDTREVTSQGSDGIGDKIDALIKAVKESSIIGHIRVIDDIDLAKRVEGGNLQRGVL
jgi:hypothetical protein